MAGFSYTDLKGYTGVGGYMNTEGDMVIPLQYELCGRFSEGLTPVMQGGAYGYIDRQGALVVPFRYEEALPFSQGRAAVRQNGCWGSLDSTGALVIPCTYGSAWSFSDGLALVEQWDESGHHAGYIDLDGNEVIPLQCDDGTIFSEGLAFARKDGVWYAIDRTGKTVFTHSSPNVSGKFSGGLCPVMDQDSRFGYIGAAGKLVIPCQYEVADDFSEGLAWVCQDGKWGAVRSDGELVIPTALDCGYEHPGPFSNGLALIPQKGEEGYRYGYMDQTGSMVIPVQFDAATSFSQDGAAVVVQGGRAGILSKPLPGNPVSPSAPLGFPDVTPGDWYYESVMALAAQGAVKGLPDGTFVPNRTISVAEFCAMSIGVLPAAVPLEESVDPGEIAEARAFLEEKNPGYWANEIIMECLGHRDVTGVWGNTRAEWSGSLTRTQMTYALSNLYLTSALYDGAQLVGDRRLAPLIGDYVSAGIQDSLFEPCILWAYGDGLIGGVNADGDFNPDGTLTRAEACAVLDRLIHPDKRLEVDWDKADRLLQEAENSDYLIRLADGTDFLGKARIHYQQDSAYDYCRALEAEIGIQIFYLPEFTYKETGMLYPSDFDPWSSTRTILIWSWRS